MELDLNGFLVFTQFRKESVEYSFFEVYICNEQTPKKNEIEKD